MQIIISGRHVNVSEEMKQHIESKITDAIDKQSLKVTSARVVLSMEKQSRYQAEVIVHMKNHDFEAAAETYEIYEAIDIAIEKIQTQVKKLVSKVQEHKKTSLREVLGDTSAPSAEEEFELDEVE